jgi:phosphate transport system substrate-binding protein
VTDGASSQYLGKVHFQPLPASVSKLSDAQIAEIAS